MIDVNDVGKEYRLVLDVPGSLQEQLELAPGPSPGTLLVRIPCREEAKEGQSVRRERGPRPDGLVYTRLVPVSWDADVAAARGELRDGVLTIVVPKTKPGHDEATRPEKRAKS